MAMAMATSGARATGWWTRTGAALAVLAAVLAGAPGAAAPAGAATPPAPDDAWVVAVYRDVLDRVPTTAQRQHRLAQLQAGRSRRAVADELVGSREHARLLVVRQYDRVLGRPADPASVTYWTDRLVAGERPTTVASFIYGSAELFGRAGGTAEGYVAFLYRDVLGREPDTAGAAYWAGRIDAGESRTGLARSWLLTPEATGLRAGLVFLDLLKRPPTATERVGWAENLRRVDERRVTAAVVASPEYGALASRPTAPTRLTGGNGPSAAPSISADGRIVAFTSTAGDLTPAGSPPGADVFVLDRRTGRLRAITAGNGTSAAPDVSADGTTVVFQSAATDLVGGDDNGRIDVFRASTAGGPVERLTAGNGDSSFPHPDADGTVVSFTSAATNLVAGDPDGAEIDAYVRTDGDPATFERIDDSSDAGTLTDDGLGMVLAASRVVEEEGAPPYAVPVADLVRLAPDADPETVMIAPLATAPRVAGDGLRVVYLDLSNGPPLMGVVVATLDAEGTVTHRETVAGGRVGGVDISHDGSAVLVDEAFSGTRVLASDGGEAPHYPDLPESSDLSGDGGLVVGSVSGQIRLFEGT